MEHVLSDSIGEIVVGKVEFVHSDGVSSHFLWIMITTESVLGCYLIIYQYFIFLIIHINNLMKFITDKLLLFSYT